MIRGSARTVSARLPPPSCNKMMLPQGALGQPGEALGLGADEEESRRNVFAFQYVKDLRSESRIRTIVKADDELVGGKAILRQLIWRGTLGQRFCADQAAFRIEHGGAVS